MSPLPSGPGARPEQELLAVARERGSRLGRRRVDDRAEVDRSRPGRAERCTRGAPEVLAAERPATARAEDDLEPVRADVGLEVVGGRVVQLCDGGRRPESSAPCLELMKISPGTFGETELREK